MELATINSLLSVADNEIKLSLGSQRICEMEKSARINLITSEYYRCIAKLGYKPKDDTEVALEVGMLIEEILSYRWMREDQLKIIFIRAAKGEYSEGQVFYSIANFNQWVKKFYAELQRVEAKLIETSKKEDQKPIPTDDELKSQACKAANDYADSIAKAKEQGKEYRFPYGGLHHLCRYLVKYNLFKPSRQVMLDMYEANKAQFSHLQGEDWKRMVYSDLYIKFVSDMADMGVRFNENFELE